jgi:hypothetical protein
VVCSSETLVHIRTTWRFIPEDCNIHNYRCENLKSYVQWYLGLRVTWFASALQDDLNFLINFNLIYEYFICRASCDHKLLELWVIVFHA